MLPHQGIFLKIIIYHNNQRRHYLYFTDICDKRQGQWPLWSFSTSYQGSWFLTPKLEIFVQRLNELAGLDQEALTCPKQNYHSILNASKGAGAMVSWLRTHTALARDLSLVPSTNTEWITTACNSRSRSHASDFRRLLHSYAHSHTQIHGSTHKNQS